jgi:ABC-type nitrate/sulfonate/bicarbonate transport system, ATPase component
MDEPFASLDAQTRTSMQNLLVDLSEKKEMTVLFVTHDILEALNISDRIVVLGDTIIDIPLNIPKEHRLKIMRF